jgi:hypothetical protein
LQADCIGIRLSDVRTLTVEEAIASLGKWLEAAVAGEGIRIRKGDAVVRNATCVRERWDKAP